MGRDKARGLAAGLVARQATTRSGRRAIRRDTPATQPVLGLRHGTLRAMTRRSARSLGAPCAQPRFVGCAPVHPTQFWTQCTVSESLFGTLSMSTVHEV